MDAFEAWLEEYRERVGGLADKFLTAEHLRAAFEAGRASYQDASESLMS